MAALDFPSAFEGLTGHKPFRWQERLFNAFLRGDIPDACDIPTGLGKTSVMPLWLIALDLHSAATRLPRRLIYVVDRRAVVDQATDEANELAKLIGDGRDMNVPPIIGAIRDRLALGPGEPLPVSTLRGQFADNHAWMDDPSKAAIVVGTVDMVGSRLLFRGYNASPRMRPVHAALMSNDALIVLDEAHLVPPFEALVSQIRGLSNADRERAPFAIPEMRFLTLSATGRGVAKVSFVLEADDENQDRIVGERLRARKWLKLEPPIAAGDLAETLAERAWQRGDGGRRVIVFCNSRKVAQVVHDYLAQRLKQQFGRGTALHDCMALMVGARRVREREELAKTGAFRRFLSRSAPQGEARAAGPPSFLVGTSAAEIGVDVNADHMVCDLVAWERMVQRLGRVNRLGKFEEGSLVDVFPALSGKDKDAEVPIEDNELGKWRAPFESGVWPPRADGRRNASPGQLRRLRDNAAFKQLTEDATTPAPLRPALMRAHVDAWSMTSLDEHSGRADVEPWLRGWVTSEPQTQVLWRQHLPIRGDDPPLAAIRVLRDFFEEAPPHLTEILESTSFEVGKLLRDRAKAVLKSRKEPETSTSEPDATADAAQAQALTLRSYVAAILSPGRKVERVLRVEEAAEIKDTRLFGRILALDVRLGGLDQNGLLSSKASRVSVLDGRSPPDSLVEESSESSLWSTERLQRIGFRVRVVGRDEPELPGWKTTYRRFLTASDEEAAEARPSAVEWRVEDWIGDRAARGEPALANAKQSVDEHHGQVARKADEICRRLGLPEELKRVVVQAAAVHDLGKMRRNWQGYAGNFGYPHRPRWPDPLAKFVTRGNPNLLKIGDLTYRHEFGSLRDAGDREDLRALGANARDVALHLIAGHHGSARPVIAAVDERYPPTVSAELAREAALRFIKLQRCWGPWGLCWLEAMLRAADVIVSRDINRTAVVVPEETVARPAGNGTLKGAA